ncbi:unnamed protein product (macronuclear) [Paramecium tetraurelia]|uniref:Tryptophan synthase beta chain-like PALP domain-containing protein n=1 Tax=Paramecium tetraurelia TaxID=5888 RepID=A0CDH1_PARTE|nr:uncharacterized protein GSPATT00007049001 [Paramecium tetraurelia]CAK68838.1 unnamed protein product [Paramecium tetraurelia]|eukprot:XP_001436235.1 hypothetical protein (macronuclear) [Paramecium tetraurelia strain d4-2]
MAAENPDIKLLDQYSNPSNPLAHYEGRAEEILWACDNKLDAIVMTTGTGGTVTGISRKIHERVPGCRAIAVDPYGSDLALLPQVNKTDIKSYKVDFIPKALDRILLQFYISKTQVDCWIKSNDKDSLSMALKLMAQEGLLCGGSSGANVWGALEWARSQIQQNDRELSLFYQIISEIT